MNVIYSFQTGLTAKYLQDKIHKQLSSISTFEFKEYESLPISKVRSEGKFFTIQEGEHKHLAFAYKKSYRVDFYGYLPKYHITRCETREEYGDYYLGNRMPVDVTDRDTGKVLKGKSLELCQNCIKQVGINRYKGNRLNMDWYDYFLYLNDHKQLPGDIIGSHGYSIYWSQISYAKRSKNKFVCDECKVDLSKHEDHMFLEVHHRDGDKTNNNSKNLSCLCVECHSKQNHLHERNYSIGPNLLKLESFKTKFGRSCLIITTSPSEKE